jgi:hypothetical protein
MTREKNPQRGEKGKKGVGNEVNIGSGYMVVVEVVRCRSSLLGFTCGPETRRESDVASC